MVPMRSAGYVAAVVCAGILGAQSPQPSGVIRGFLAPGPSASEQFIVRSNGNEFPFRRDCLTWIEREQQRIAFSELRTGEHIEVICDRDDPAPHYARVIHVIAEPHRTTYRLPRNPIEFLAPRGELVMSGVVSQLVGDAMLLHTRRDGNKIVYLQADTRFLKDGSRTDATELRPNLRIFVRAGRNLDNEIVAYQIVWGAILEPEP